MVIGRSGQRLHRARRLRPRRADGQLDLRVVRRVHGVVPDRRADQQARRRRRARRRRPARRRVDPRSCRSSRASRGTFLELNQGAVVKRRIKAGEIICREGEFGSTAFYILEGTRRDLHQRRRSRTSSRRTRAGGWFSSIRSKLVGPRRSTRGRRRAAAATSRSTRRSICPYDKPIARAGGRRSLRRDDLHELPSAVGDRAREDRGASCWRCCATCSTSSRRTRRSAPSSIASTAQRALETHLGACRCSPSMPPEFIDYLRDRVELLRYSPGEVIVRQGDAADAFYLVRIGFVKVTERHPGGELVLTYLGRGGVLRRDGAARRRRPHRDLHGARPRRRRADRRRGLPPDARRGSRTSARASRRWRASAPT